MHSLLYLALSLTLTGSSLFSPSFSKKRQIFTTEAASEVAAPTASSSSAASSSALSQALSSAKNQNNSTRSLFGGSSSSNKVLSSDETPLLSSTLSSNAKKDDNDRNHSAAVTETEATGAAGRNGVRRVISFLFTLLLRLIRFAFLPLLLLLKVVVNVRWRVQPTIDTTDTLQHNNTCKNYTHYTHEVYVLCICVGLRLLTSV